MQLLVFSPWFPFPPDNGSRLRAYHLIRQLTRKGHTIRLVVGVQDDRKEILTEGVPAELQELATEIVVVPWKWYSGNEVGGKAQIQALLSPVPRSIRETPNLELVAALQAQLQKPTEAVLALELGSDAYLPPLPKHLPAIIDQVEVSGMERAYRQATTPLARIQAFLTWKKSHRYWRTRLRRYQIVTAVSEEEATVVRKWLGIGTSIPPVHVLPNGVDVSAFPERSPTTRVSGRMLYNGALSYGPNRDAVYWFVREILPQIVTQRPDVQLYVTGRYKAEEHRELLENKHVHLTGFLPELQPVLAEASVSVVPLLSGGGTRLKILEAWAAHLPVVSTTIGAVGLGAVSGGNLLLADTAADFAAATLVLLNEPERAARLAQQARHEAETRFDWQIIGEQLNVMLETVIQQVNVVRK